MTTRKSKRVSDEKVLPDESLIYDGSGVNQSRLDQTDGSDCWEA